MRYLATKSRRSLRYHLFAPLLVRVRSQSAASRASVCQFEQQEDTASSRRPSQARSGYRVHSSTRWRTKRTTRFAMSVNHARPAQRSQAHAAGTLGAWQRRSVRWMDSPRSRSRERTATRPSAASPRAIALRTKAMHRNQVRVASAGYRGEAAAASASRNDIEFACGLSISLVLARSRGCVALQAQCKNTAIATHLSMMCAPRARRHATWLALGYPSAQAPSDRATERSMGSSVRALACCLVCCPSAEYSHIGKSWRSIPIDSRASSSDRGLHGWK